MNADQYASSGFDCIECKKGLYVDLRFKAPTSDR